MKKVVQIMFFSFVLFLGVSTAQTIFLESFDYTANAGDSLKAHGWTLSGTNNLNPLRVITPGLTFAGYSSKGNATKINEVGQDVYKAFTAISSGSVYLSFLMNAQSASSIGDYFIAMSPASSQTNYYARVHLKAQGTGFQIGISKSNELAGGYVYGNTVLTFNTTYLVVIKHALISGATNDEERIFVFSSAAPATEPTTSEVGPYVETTKTDPTDLGIITLRQGGALSGGVLTNAGPVMKMDEIKISNSWNSIFTGIEKVESTIPSSFSLSQNYPNPFNPATVINFSLPQSENVSLKIYSLLGEEVATPVNGQLSAGNYKYDFNGKNLTSGVYFYKLQVGNFTETKKMLLTK